MSIPTVAQSQSVVDLPDGSSINVVHLAGGVEQPLKILFLHANGFHINCLGPLVRSDRGLSMLQPRDSALNRPSAQARCLKQHALCIGVELRGQGATQAPNPAEQLVTAYIQDVAAVIQNLHLQGNFSAEVADMLLHTMSHNFPML